MKQIAWYVEGWDIDDDDFDDEDPAWCDICKEKPEVPLNPNRRFDADTRRQVLTAAGLSTYELNPQDTTIVCLCCGMLSAHPGDIKNKYCPFCHKFHTEKLSHDPDL